MFPDSVLLSLSGCEDGDTDRLMNLVRKVLCSFFSPEKSKLLLHIVTETLLITAGFSLHLGFLLSCASIEDLLLTSFTTTGQHKLLLFSELNALLYT